MAPLAPAGFTQITIGGTTYNIPNNGASPTWGLELNQYLSALGSAINGLSGAYDVLDRLSIFSSAPTAYTDVPSVVLDPTVVNGGIITYSARYTTSSVTAVELGQAYAVYNPNNAASAKFDIALQHAGSAGLSFYLTDLGQLQLSCPTGIAGTGFSLRFRVNVKAFEL